MTPKDKVAPRITGTSFDGTGFVLALASMADNDAVLAFRLRNRQFFGYAKAYLQIAGRWQDHVLTALTNDAVLAIPTQ